MEKLHDPAWLIVLGFGLVTVVIVMVGWLLMKRLNFFVSVILKNSIDTDTQRKADATSEASKLAQTVSDTAVALSKTVEETAAGVKADLVGTVEQLGKKVEETSTEVKKELAANPSTLLVNVKDMNVETLTAAKKKE